MGLGTCTSRTTLKTMFSDMNFGVLWAARLLCCYVFPKWLSHPTGHLTLFCFVLGGGGGGGEYQGASLHLCMKHKVQRICGEEKRSV